MPRARGLEALSHLTAFPQEAELTSWAVSMHGTGHGHRAVKPLVLTRTANVQLALICPQRSSIRKRAAGLSTIEAHSQLRSGYLP